MHSLTPATIQRLNDRFNAAEPGFESTAAIITWAAEQLMPRLAMTSSFQTQSVALLHMLSRVQPDIPVIFLDTGYHFPETLAYRDDLVARFGLTVRVVRSATPHAEQVRQHGDALYRRDPDLCCYINKVEPMQRALRELGAGTWFSGLRRQQAESRAETPIAERRNGRWKIHPIADWNDREVGQYLSRHDLPYHPLWEQGYVSIGDVHTTRKLEAGMREEDTRFFGLKRECGLHEDWGDGALAKSA